MKTAVFVFLYKIFDFTIRKPAINKVFDKKGVVNLL